METTFAEQVATDPEAARPWNDRVSIEFGYSNNETWRIKRLWKVVQSLTAEQASQIVWLYDHKGMLRVGLHNPRNPPAGLTTSIRQAWEAQCECVVEFAGPTFNSDF